MITNKGMGVMIKEIFGDSETGRVASGAIGKTMFSHCRSDGLAICLEKAAEAVRSCNHIDDITPRRKEVTNYERTRS